MDDTERRIIHRFEKYGELFELQNRILSLSFSEDVSQEQERDEFLLFRRVTMIFAEYQEQSFLVDPYLEGLVVPVAEKLKTQAQLWVNGNAKELSERSVLSYTSQLLYQYIKFRGHKMIVRFFPHEVGDLTTVVHFMSSLEKFDGSWVSLWSLRYSVLLWLSLICKLPFDLDQFDDQGRPGETASVIESFGVTNLSKSGLERDGAALLLSQLYARKDTRGLLNSFVARVNSPGYLDQNLFETIGVLQTLAAILKGAPAELVSEHIPTIIRIGQCIQTNESLMTNASVHKLRVKLISRAGLRLLPSTSLMTRRRGRELSNAGENVASNASNPDEEFDVPEEIEGVLEDIFPAIQDRDTIVRWAAAKAVARVCERLPAEFIDQVVDTVLGLFSIHSQGVASLYDIPAIAESTWQGACLACAELCRRGLIPHNKLPILADWMLQALAFDIRKGAHSVGSNVRDAAAYVLWSLARAYSPDVLRPFCDQLSKKLVVTAVYDREVHIRRAASATFQEYVGRTELFPDGIDVLRKTDFFVVGIRRNAFLISAPEVAEHTFYRSALIDHLLSITLRHWDPSMRELGSQSLRRICELDLPTLGPDCVARARKLLSTSDTSDIHGALLALTELAAAFRDSKSVPDSSTLRKEIFSMLGDVPTDVIKSPRNELITSAACLLIANSISHEDVHTDGRSPVSFWRKTIDLGLKHRSSSVQESAATALAQVSKLVDCTSIVERSGSPFAQQSLARLLGVLDYTAYENGLSKAVSCLLESVDKKSRFHMANIEARRNCYNSIPMLLSNVTPNLLQYLTVGQAVALFNALILGLGDYTVDERGDVGSWVRIACIKGSTEFSRIMFQHASSIPDFATYFPPDRYHVAVAGILKQGVERLDNVRQQAGECLISLLKERLPAIPDASRWEIHDTPLLKHLFCGEGAPGWQESTWLFPRAVRLLEIKEYRNDVLNGLLLSVTSKTDSTKRPVSSSLTAYVQRLPVSTASASLDLRTLVSYLVVQAKGNLSSNSNVIPILQMFSVLLEADALEALRDDEEGLKSLEELLAISTRGVSKLKSVHRIQACMRTTVNLLAFPRLYKSCVSRLADFLTHEYPKIRGDTAEYLYLVLQSQEFDRDLDEAEELLAETEWMSDDISLVQKATRKLVDAMGQA